MEFYGDSLNFKEICKYIISSNINHGKDFLVHVYVKPSYQISKKEQKMCCNNLMLWDLKQYFI